MVANPLTTNSYAGDLTPREAWDYLNQYENAVLVDVRTRPEWEFVGVPNLTDIGRQPLFIEWQHYGAGANENFIDQVRNTGLPEDTPLLLLCRSGVRSLHAAVALTQAGFQTCFNISDGFEGQLDAERHRGAGDSGWKASGLPWIQ